MAPLLPIHRPSMPWHLDGSVVEHLLAHWFTDFCSDCVKSYNTAALRAEVLTVHVRPLLSLITYLTVPSFSNISQIQAIVQRVGGSDSNSVQHCRCTSWMFSYFQYHFSTVWHCSSITPGTDESSKAAFGKSAFAKTCSNMISFVKDMTWQKCFRACFSRKHFTRCTWPDHCFLWKHLAMHMRLWLDSCYQLHYYCDCVWL